MKLKILILLTALFSTAGFSQIPTITEKSVFSIITVDVAKESHTLYGHTALRVKDSIAGFDVVYNYGMFDFSTPNFLLKFTKGDLQYYAAVYPFSDFDYSYRTENRSFYEQKLQLTFTEKKELFQKLNTSVFGSEKYYTYKFIDRNCTTKVIDIVNSVLKDRPIQNTLHQNESYRDILYGYQKEQFYLNFGINIIFGHRPDEQAAVLFLPMDLLEVLKTSKHNGKLLAEAPQKLFQATDVTKSFSFWNSGIPIILVLLLVLISNKKALHLVYFSLLGSVGLFFTAVNLYSLHREVLWNYNMLLFNPLFIILAISLLQNNSKWTKKTILALLVCIVMYFVYMLPKVHFWMVLPWIITTAIILGRLFLKTKQKETV